MVLEVVTKCPWDADNKMHNLKRTQQRKVLSSILTLFMVDSFLLVIPFPGFASLTNRLHENPPYRPQPMPYPLHPTATNHHTYREPTAPTGNVIPTG